MCQLSNKPKVNTMMTIEFHNLFARICFTRGSDITYNRSPNQALRLTARITNFLYFADLPTGTRMTSGLNNTVVLAGGLLFLNCTSDANPAVHAFQLIFNSTLIAISNSGMFSVTVRKAGIYTCIPVNEVGSGDSATVKVTVLGK